MGLDDVPILGGMLIDLGAIPTESTAGEIGHAVECEDSRLPVELYSGVDEFLTIKLYFASESLVVVRESLSAVYASLEKWIKVDHLGRRYLEVTRRVTLSPSIECGAFHGDECVCDIVFICAHREHPFAE